MSTIRAHTLQDWVKAFRDDVNTISSFALQIAKSDGNSAVFFADESVLSKYTVELSEYLETVELNPREQDYYRYNPRLLAYDLYGIPEFWYLILFANELHSALDFHPKRVKFFNMGVVNILNTIRMLEQGRLDDNQQEMTDVVVNNEVVNNDISSII